MLPLLLGSCSLKMDQGEMDTVLWSDMSKFEILIENQGSHIPRAKEETDHQACYQRTV